MPTKPQEAFRTHSNYLQAFDVLIASHHLPSRGPFVIHPNARILTAVAAAVRASPAFARLQRRTGVDIGALTTVLKNAWGTELLLESIKELAHDELIGLATNWAVVQAYYACYNAAQALAIMQGNPRPDTHAKTQRVYTAYWVTRPAHLPPWSLGWTASGCLNLPTGRGVQMIHPWATCDKDTCWDLVAMALRTTRQELATASIREERQRRQSSNRRQWKQDEKQRIASRRRPRKEPRFTLPQLPPADKREIESRLRPTTLIDYLYRLRLRSNYEDATMFTDGPERATDSWMVYQNLCRITSTTLLAHELHVGKVIGQDRLKSLADEWLAASKVSAPNLGLAARRDVLFEGS